MNTHNIMTGIMSALMACTGGAVMVVQAAEAVGLNKYELISWFFAVYVLGGLLNLAMTLTYKIPFAGAHSITSAAFIASTMSQFSIHELAGGFVMSGVLIFILGITGWFGKLFTIIPKPLIDALLAGVIVNYVVKAVPALKDAPLVGCLAVAGFFITSRLSKKVPPIMGVLVLGIIGLFIGYDFPALPNSEFYLVQFVSPSFTVTGFFSIAIPISVLILSNDLAVALAALKRNGFDPPVNRTLAISGIASACVGIFGGQAANVGGMMSALCSSEDAGPKGDRRWAAIVSSILVILFGLFAWKVVDMIRILPSSFIVIVTGFSLLGVLMNAFRSAFSDSSYRFSILFTFIIAASNVNILGISSPVWALMFGVIAAKWFQEGKL